MDRESCRGESFLFKIMNGFSSYCCATLLFLSFNIFGKKNWVSRKGERF